MPESFYKTIEYDSIDLAIDGIAQSHMTGVLSDMERKTLANLPKTMTIKRAHRIFNRIRYNAGEPLLSWSTIHQFCRKYVYGQYRPVDAVEAQQRITGISPLDYTADETPKAKIRKKPKRRRKL